MATCCGRNFCHSCIQWVLARNGVQCPVCRNDNFKLIPNEVLNDALKLLQVYCTHERDGCQWKGGLEDLAQHLSLDEECPPTVVEDTEDAKQGSHMVVT